MMLRAVTEHQNEFAIDVLVIILELEQIHLLITSSFCNMSI